MAATGGLKSHSQYIIGKALSKMLLQVQTHRLIRDRELRKRAGTLAHRHLATLSVHKTDVGFDVVRPCCWAVSVETVENVEPESAPYSVFLPVLRKSTNEVYKHRPAALIKSRTLRWLSGCYLLQNRSLQFHICNEVIRQPRSAPPSRRAPAPFKAFIRRRFFICRFSSKSQSLHSDRL